MPPHNHTHHTDTNLVPASRNTLAPGREAMPNATIYPEHADLTPVVAHPNHPPNPRCPILGGLPRGERPIFYLEANQRNNYPAASGAMELEAKQTPGNHQNLS